MLGLAAPKPPAWEYDDAVLLLRLDPPTLGSLPVPARSESPVALMWLKISDNDLLSHIFGGIPSEIAARAAFAGPEIGRARSGADTDNLFQAERAVYSLAVALSNGTRVEVDVVSNNPMSSSTSIFPGNPIVKIAVLASQLKPALVDPS